MSRTEWNNLFWGYENLIVIQFIKKPLLRLKYEGKFGSLLGHFKKKFTIE